MKAKSTFSLIMLLAFLLCQSVYATKWRVSNVPGVVANFTTLQQANDASSVLAGDTVYLEGSTVNYNDVTINKKLIIVGPGFFLGENDSTQANKVPSTVNNMTLVTGSEGSVITGVSMSGALLLNAGSILLKRCYSAAQTTIYSSNNILIQSFFQRMYIYQPAQNNLIKNNVLWAPPYTGEYSLYMDDGTNAVVYNNIFLGHQRICNADYRNNISTGTAWWSVYFYVAGSCTVKNNISASNQYSSYPDNLINQDLNAIFICWNDCTGRTTDNKYKLLYPTSPAIGYGYNGTDCGIFGGAQPYVLSGIPAFPAVWELVVDGITVTVKAKSH